MTRGAVRRVVLSVGRYDRGAAHFDRVIRDRVIRGRDDLP
jgi:hypothetical protein